MMKENSVNILNYVKEHSGEVTANDIATALGLTARQVNGTLTALQRKTYIVRVPAKDAEGNDVKIIEITEAGAAFDPTAEAK